MKRSNVHGTTLWRRLFSTALLATTFFLLSTAYKAHGAGMLIADGGFGGVLEIKEHDVQVTINNGVASPG